MTLVQLRHFVSLAQAGSFVAASGKLHMTQPALSRSIKALEDELGQRLFDRVGRRIELSAFGREALVRSRSLLEDAGQLAASGRGLAQLSSGRVRLGLSSGPGALLTAPLVARFAARFPLIRLDIVRANTEALAQMLRERKVDALIVDARSLRPAPDLKVHGLIELPGAFMCRPGHPLAGLRRVSLERLMQFPVASTPLSDELARILVERYGEQAHPETLVRYSSDELAHLVEIARSTDTLLLAARAVAPDLQEVALRPALEARARYGLVTVASRADALFLPEVLAVMQSILESTP